MTSDKLSFNPLTNAKVMAMASQLFPKNKNICYSSATLITFMDSLTNYLGPVMEFS